MKNRHTTVFIRGIGGAVATTLVSGVAAAKNERDWATGTITGSPSWKGLHLIEPSDIHFHGWDIAGESLYERSVKHSVLANSFLGTVKADLNRIKVHPSIIRTTDLSENEIESENPKLLCLSAKEAVDHFKLQIIKCLRASRSRRGIAVNLTSTERFNSALLNVQTEGQLREMIKKNDSRLTSGVLFAVAALEAGCAYLDFTPDMTLECPAIISLAKHRKLPVMGKDGSTGQTLLKLVLAEMFVRRNLKINGWYSTNILGNNDGRVLAKPGHRETKMRDKLEPLSRLLKGQDFDHVVDISYYKPRGDRKESWDVVDFKGWLGQEMSLRVNWQGIDSILAAPLVLDLVRLLEKDMELGHSGLSKHLGVFFKHPIGVQAISFFSNYNLLHRHYGIKADIL